MVRPRNRVFAGPRLTSLPIRLATCTSTALLRSPSMPSPSLVPWAGRTHRWRGRVSLPAHCLAGGRATAYIHPHHGIGADAPGWVDWTAVATGCSTSAWSSCWPCSWRGDGNVWLDGLSSFTWSPSEYVVRPRPAELLRLPSEDLHRHHGPMTSAGCWWSRYWVRRRRGPPERCGGSLLDRRRMSVGGRPDVVDRTG